MFKNGAHQRETLGSVTSMDDSRGILEREHKLAENDTGRETTAGASTPVELSNPS